MPQNSDDRSLAVITHVISILVGFLMPLIVLLASDKEFVKANAKNALNWQFSLIIYSIISFVLVFVLIGFFLIPILYVANIVFCIIAAVRANEGKAWKYPLAIPFFRT